MPAAKRNVLLPAIIFSQFAGTSLWFAGNAVIDQLGAFDGHASITSIVQLGFIAGTLVFSLLTIADRYQPSKVFFLSSCAAALANLLIIWLGENVSQLWVLRFITGFFLAGIYPVGMKIAADLFPEKLGKVLGFLVGALVLGTAFPHLIRSQLEGLNWRMVLVITSSLALTAGLLILLTIPAKTKNADYKRPDVFAAVTVFRSPAFRSAAFGYFGHMWELYALWSILPAVFTYHNLIHAGRDNIYFWSFLVIAAGAAGCVLGGLLSQRLGSKKVAFYSLLLSGICSVLSGFLFHGNAILFHLLFLVWGITVTADSPQFSALVAKNAEEKNRGTALSIVTSFGFAITIVSIQLLKNVFDAYKEKGLWLLAIGPVLGLMALRKPT